MAQTAISDNEILEAALIGLERQRSQVDEQMAELRRRLGIRASRVSSIADSVSPDGASPARKRRPFSAAARRRMAEAQRKRWAAVKKGAAAKAGK